MSMIALTLLSRGWAAYYKHETADHHEPVAHCSMYPWCSTTPSLWTQTET